MYYQSWHWRTSILSWRTTILVLENPDPYPDNHDPNPENNFLEIKLKLQFKANSQNCLIVSSRMSSI